MSGLDSDAVVLHEETCLQLVAGCSDADFRLRLTTHELARIVDEILQHFNDSAAVHGHGGAIGSYLDMDMPVTNAASHQIQRLLDERSAEYSVRLVPHAADGRQRQQLFQKLIHFVGGFGDTAEVGPDAVDTSGSQVLIDHCDVAFYGDERAFEIVRNGVSKPFHLRGSRLQLGLGTFS